MDTKGAYGQRIRKYLELKEKLAAVTAELEQERKTSKFHLERRLELDAEIRALQRSLGASNDYIIKLEAENQRLREEIKSSHADAEYIAIDARGYELPQGIGQRIQSLSHKLRALY